MCKPRTPPRHPPLRGQTSERTLGARRRPPEDRERKEGFGKQHEELKSLEQKLDKKMETLEAKIRVVKNLDETMDEIKKLMSSEKETSEEMSKKIDRIIRFGVGPDVAGASARSHSPKNRPPAGSPAAASQAAAPSTSPAAGWGVARKSSSRSIFAGSSLRSPTKGR